MPPFPGSIRLLIPSRRHERKVPRPRFCPFEDLSGSVVAACALARMGSAEHALSRSRQAHAILRVGEGSIRLRNLADVLIVASRREARRAGPRAGPCFRSFRIFLIRSFRTCSRDVQDLEEGANSQDLPRPRGKDLDALAREEDRHGREQGRSGATGAPGTRGL